MMLVHLWNGVSVYSDQVEAVCKGNGRTIAICLKGGSGLVLEVASHVSVTGTMAELERLIAEGNAADDKVGNSKVAETSGPVLSKLEYLRLQCLQMAVEHANVLEGSSRAMAISISTSGRPNVQKLCEDFMVLMGLIPAPAKPMASPTQQGY